MGELSGKFDVWALLGGSLGKLNGEFDTWFLLGERQGELSGELDKRLFSRLSNAPTCSTRCRLCGSPTQSFLSFILSDAPGPPVRSTPAVECVVEVEAQSTVMSDGHVKHASACSW